MLLYYKDNELNINHSNINYMWPGAYERREAARRSVKLQYVSGSISCRITHLQTALYGKRL